MANQYIRHRNNVDYLYSKFHMDICRLLYSVCVVVYVTDTVKRTMACNQSQLLNPGTPTIAPYDALLNADGAVVDRHVHY